MPESVFGRLGGRFGAGKIDRAGGLSYMLDQLAKPNIPALSRNRPRFT